MSALDINDDTVFVSKLRKTDTLQDGRIRQIFDVVNMPGLHVVCLSEFADDTSGELREISQEYCLANGKKFSDLDEAVLAWDDLKADLELTDRLAGALLRHHHGLMRPLWEHRTDAQKQPWIIHARHLLQIAESVGLSITTTEPR